METLENRQAFVTGASRGIGKSISEYLIADSIKVIGTSRISSFPEKFKNNDQFEGLKVDLKDENEVKEQIEVLFKRDEAPNIIVNNAGISENAPFSRSDDEWLKNWDRTMQINLKMPALICKWALNNWQNNSTPGIIINISSRAGFRGDTSEFASYAASKGGLAAFTKSIARNFGKFGITAYTIAPGFVETDMAHEVKQVYGDDYLKKDLALDELTPPEQIAQVVKFLANGNARHMTGSTFHINAGSYMV